VKPEHLKFHPLNSYFCKFGVGNFPPPPKRIFGKFWWWNFFLLIPRHQPSGVGTTPLHPQNSVSPPSTGFGSEGGIQSQLCSRKIILAISGVTNGFDKFHTVLFRSWEQTIRQKLPSMSAAWISFEPKNPNSSPKNRSIAWDWAIVSFPSTSKIGYSRHNHNKQKQWTNSARETFCKDENLSKPLTWGKYANFASLSRVDF